LEGVNPENSNTKMNDLLLALEFFFREMDFNYSFFTKHWYMKYIGDNTRIFEIIAMIIAIVMNILMLLSFDRNEKTAVPSSIKSTVRFLAFFQIFLSSILTGVWLNVRYFLEVKIQKKLFAKQNPQKKSMNIIDIVQVYLVDSFLTQEETRTFLWHMACCSCGITINEFFYAMALLIVVNASRDLLYVFKSITEHGTQLMLTGLLGIIMVFVYANFSFWFFAEYFKDIDTLQGTQDNMCESLWLCFFLVMNSGFLYGGGLADATKTESYYHWDKFAFASKMAFDVSFFFIVNVIFVNLIFGIIIDTFGELREKSTQKEYDNESVCFICNLTKTTLTHYQEDFIEHREKKHDVWSYVFYFYKLQKLTEKDMSGEELYLSRKLAAKDLSLFPIDRHSRKRMLPSNSLIS
jgi:hypothetical protein